ncbi:acyl-CoA thioesterase [Sessilibacter corallicola]|uniref:Acyl-CoA thioesterase n=1 Tax=Sessilibacter corallicola TaxID=2904075 RepID=A0ABQ0ABS7_9GAMM|nr:hotdog domain-containing protein [Sessilibacter corallicola]MCE2027937.1 acyl-CoA thioesterase [Sessilibacter corallicola]
MSHSYNEIDETPLPTGELALQTVAMPHSTNSQGDIYAGWLLSQMDIAGSTVAQEYAHGRVTTVAVGSMAFLRPVPVGSQVRCYVELLEIGRSSIKTRVEVWLKQVSSNELMKVTEGEFVYVAIDENGRTRSIKD